MRKTAIAVVIIISTIILFLLGATLYQHFSTGGYVEPEVIEGTVIGDTYIMTTGSLFAGTARHDVQDFCRMRATGIFKSR